MKVSIPTNFIPSQLHHKTPDLYTEVEARVAEAIDSISNTQNVNLSQLATNIDIPKQ